MRIKIKGSEYLRIHRLVSRVTPVALWEQLADPTAPDLDVMRREIPEEFWRDFDAIRGALTGAFDALVAAVDVEKARVADLDDKALGLALPSLPAAVRPLIFHARNHGAGWSTTPRLRAALWRHVRPTGNALAGYTPSEQLHRATDDG